MLLFWEVYRSLLHRSLAPLMECIRLFCHLYCITKALLVDDSYTFILLIRLEKFLFHFILDIL